MVALAFTFGAACLHCYTLLTLVISTTSVILVDGAKLAVIVSCSGSYWSNLHPVVIFFKVEILGNHLYIYVKLW